MLDLHAREAVGRTGRGVLHHGNIPFRGTGFRHRVSNSPIITVPGEDRVAQVGHPILRSRQNEKIEQGCALWCDAGADRSGLTREYTKHI